MEESERGEGGGVGKGERLGSERGGNRREMGQEAVGGRG